MSVDVCHLPLTALASLFRRDQGRAFRKNRQQLRIPIVLPVYGVTVSLASEIGVNFPSAPEIMGRDHWESGFCGARLAGRAAWKFTIFEKSGKGAISRCGSCPETTLPPRRVECPLQGAGGGLSVGGTRGEGEHGAGRCCRRAGAGVEFAGPVSRARLNWKSVATLGKRAVQ
jgi:hypothetical protein